MYERDIDEDLCRVRNWLAESELWPEICITDGAQTSKRCREVLKSPASCALRALCQVRMSALSCSTAMLESYCAGWMDSVLDGWVRDKDEKGEDKAEATAGRIMMKSE
jgi:hypothetical protein